jgi:hypothetical protein
MVGRHWGSRKGSSADTKIGDYLLKLFILNLLIDLLISTIGLIRRK